MLDRLWHFIVGGSAWCRVHFEAIAGWASIVGLAVSCITLWQVGSIRSSHLAKDLLPVREKLFKKIIEQLAEKPKLTESHRRDIQYLLRRLRTYNVSWMWWRHRRVKKLMKNLQSDLEADGTPDAILNQIETLEVEIRHLSDS